nr:SNF2-related protein [Ipomoea trifida]
MTPPPTFTARLRRRCRLECRLPPLARLPPSSTTDLEGKSRLLDFQFEDPAECEAEVFGRGGVSPPRLPILVLPPTDIQVIECEQSEAEHGFYDALYKKSLPGSGKKFSS